MRKTRNVFGAIVIFCVIYQIQLISGRAANLLHQRPSAFKRDELRTRGEAIDIPPILSNEQDDSKNSQEGLKLAEKWLELEVVPPPRLPVKLHDDLVLECTAVGSPPPNVYWMRDEKPIDDLLMDSSSEVANQIQVEKSSLFEKSGFVMSKVVSKLPIRCLRPEDEARYTCVADNGSRQVSASTVVAIEEDDPSGEMKPSCELRFAHLLFSKKSRRGSPAYVAAAETLHMESIGADIVLPCRGAGRPLPKITWIDSEGQTIVSGKKFQMNSNGDLAIRNLSWNEMGEYSCVVENPFGKDTVSTFLYPLMTEGS